MNRNSFASTIAPVVDYLHSPSLGKGSSGNSTSVQSNERDTEPFRLPWFQLRHPVQYTEKENVIVLKPYLYGISETQRENSPQVVSRESNGHGVLRSRGQVHAEGTSGTSDTLQAKARRVDKTSIVASSCSPRCRTCSATMTPSSTNESPSILQDGKLKPGIYKIWNISTETYVDIEVQSRVVCCRPARDLEEGNGLVRFVSPVCSSCI